MFETCAVPWSITHLRSATQPPLPVPRSAFEGQSGTPRHRGLKAFAYGSCVRKVADEHELLGALLSRSDALCCCSNQCSTAGVTSLSIM